MFGVCSLKGVGEGVEVSNTTPIFANKILGEDKYQNMDDNDNASLYIVTVSDDKRISEVEKVEK